MCIIYSVDNILFRKKNPFFRRLEGIYFFKRHISVRNECCNTWLEITADLLRVAHSVIYGAVIFVSIFLAWAVCWGCERSVSLIG